MLHLPTDFINAIFEGLLGVFVLMSVAKLRRDKKVRGIAWPQVAFCTAWGIWNFWFYSYFGAWLSLAAGTFLAVVNSWYLYLLWYYIAQEKKHALRPLTEPTRDKTWCETYSGRQFWLLDPDPDAVVVGDIAHAMGYQCRYNGHTENQTKPWRDDFYSVAEHCCLLFDWCLANGYSMFDAFCALVHDASEAYSGDIPRPWKNALPRIRELEGDLDAVVLPRLGGVAHKPDWLDEIDLRILQDERAQARHPTSNSWCLEGYEPLGVEIQFWRPDEATHEWMKRYRMAYAALGMDQVLEPEEFAA